MTSSTNNVDTPRIVHVDVSRARLSAELSDGSIVSVPVGWYPRLFFATPDERAHWELIGRGFGIHWPAPDEDISVENLLQQRRSGEGSRSRRRWLAERASVGSESVSETLGHVSKRWHFLEYVRLLLALHRIIADGKGNDAQADELRDKMDGPWHGLDASEVAAVRGLAADLYTIGENRNVPVNGPSAEHRAQIDAALEHKDWLTTLELLRQAEPCLIPHGVAFCRGFCWAGLGQDAVAAEFFQEARRLGSTAFQLEPFLLASQIKSGQIDDAIVHAERIRQADTDAFGLLAAAAVFANQMSQSNAGSADVMRERTISTAERGLQLAKDWLAGNPSASQVHVDLLKCMQADIYWVLAEAYGKAGNRAKARQACLDALQLDPHHQNSTILLSSLNDEISVVVKTPILPESLFGPLRLDSYETPLQLNPPIAEVAPHVGEFH